MSDDYSDFKAVSNDYSEFKTVDVPQPERNIDLASESIAPARGINRSVALTLTAPYRAIDWVQEKIGGKDRMTDAEQLPLVPVVPEGVLPKSIYDQLPDVPRWGDYINPRQAETTIGQYAQAVGEGVGAAVVPMGVTGGLARTAQTADAATTVGRIGQEMVRFARQNPGTAAATELAGATGQALATKAADDFGVPKYAQPLIGLAGGVAATAPLLGRGVGRVGSQEAQDLAENRATQTLNDIAAFDRQGIRQFGPAYNQGAVRATARQLAESLPGAPLRNNLDETFKGAAAATQRLADDLGEGRTMEDVGNTIGGALKRFADDSLQDLDPSDVAALRVVEPNGTSYNINPQSVRTQATRGASAQMKRLQQDDPGIQQLTGRSILPEQRPQRTTVEDLNTAELDTVINTPPEMTSSRTLIDALYERARRNIPALFDSADRAAPPKFATSNASQAIKAAEKQFQTAGVRPTLGRYKEMFETLKNSRANLTIDRIRAMRTQIGRDLANIQAQDFSIDAQALRRVYGALSDDIEMAMRDLVARTFRKFQNRSNAVPVSADDVVKARRALDDLNNANQMTRALKVEEEGALRMRKLAERNPDGVTRSLVREIQEGGNSMEARRVLQMLRPNERQQVAGHVVRQLGQPSNSATGIISEVGWSPNTFLTNYRKLKPEMRDMIFSAKHQEALDDLYRVADRLANVEALANHSRSFSNAQNMALLSGGGVLAMSDLPSALMIGGSMLGASVLMSTPAYTRFLTKYITLRAQVRSGVDGAFTRLARHVKNMDKLATASPSLLPVMATINKDIGQLSNGQTEAE
jgi:hypothetical protein